MKKCKLGHWGMHLSMRGLLAVSLAALWLAPGVRAADEGLEARVRSLVARQDAAASRQDLEGLFAAYAPSFKSADGLDLDATRRAVAALWTRLLQPSYQTEVATVVSEKGGVRVRATTRLKAFYRNELSDKGSLDATVETLSRYEDQRGNLKLVSQQILSERTALRVGEKPPEASIEIPATVRPGKSFKVEAILATPLEQSPALGGIRLTAIGPRNAAVVQAPPLEVLRTGGLFKTGKAPNRPEDQAVTLAFVDGGGALLVNQRLRVTEAVPPKAAGAAELLGVPQLGPAPTPAASDRSQR